MMRMSRFSPPTKLRPFRFVFFFNPCRLIFRSGVKIDGLNRLNHSCMYLAAARKGEGKSEKKTDREP